MADERREEVAPLTAGAGDKALWRVERLEIDLNRIEDILHESTKVILAKQETEEKRVDALFLEIFQFKTTLGVLRWVILALVAITAWLVSNAQAVKSIKSIFE